MVLLLSFLSITLYFIVIFLKNVIQEATFKDWLAFIFAITAIIYIGWVIRRVLRRRIVLNRDRLYVSDDIGNKDIKLQMV